MSGTSAVRVTGPIICPISGHGSRPIAAGFGDVFFDGFQVAPWRLGVWRDVGWGACDNRFDRWINWPFTEQILTRNTEAGVPIANLVSTRRTASLTKLSV